MNPILAFWRKLDRYLIRNHAELWLLQMHRIHSWVLGTFLALALIVFLAPLQSLIGVSLKLRGLLGLLMFFLAFVWTTRVSTMGRQGQPFVRRTNWPRILSHWYALAVISSPFVILPWLIQTRVQQEITQGSTAKDWSAILEHCGKQIDALASTPCSTALTNFSGHPEERVGEDDIELARQTSQILSSAWLNPFLKDQRMGWLNFLLLLLLVAYSSLIYDLAHPRSTYLEGLPQSQALALPSLGFIVILEPPNIYISSIAIGVTTILVLCALTQALLSHRRTTTITLAWSMVLIGLPALVVLSPIVLLEEHNRVSYQLLLLGLLLLLTPRLERLHDRIRALPF